MLENAEDREYTRRVKDNSKILEETYDLKIKTSEHKVAADDVQMFGISICRTRRMYTRQPWKR